MAQASRSSREVRASGRPTRRTIGRLTRYEITELFGVFNYKFDLDIAGITLLTGVNGTGKSTILRTIDAISRGNWPALLEIPFKSLILGFDDDRELIVNREESQVSIALTGEKTWEAPSPLLFSRFGFISSQTEWVEAYEQLAMLDRQGRLTPAERVLRNELAHRGLPSRDSDPTPTWLGELSFNFPVLFITDQRLIVDSPRRNERESSQRISTRVAADEAARQIAHEISVAKSAYANRSQVLDRDLPQRVVKALGQSPRIGEQVLRQRLDELTRQSRDLESVGLSPTESVGEFEDLDLAAAHVRSFMKVYIADAQTKLSVLEALRVKLQLFTQFLKQHYGRKYVQIDPDRGFIIRFEGKEASELQPSRLSSGEQQILVLAHEILFKATPGTLVLIDEPELSLHVLWQASFVDDLAVMGQVNNLSFLLATHSPTLIGGRDDLKRSLDVLGR
jgi:ABC-type branched-subunit amino acid transport system ATPase component